MIIKLNRLKQIIQEYYTGSEDDVLGKHAFAQQRMEVPHEINNTYENELLDVIKNYLLNNVKIPTEDVKIIQTFLNSGEYSDIFREPRTFEVYRGMAVHYETLSHFLNKGDTSELELNGEADVDFLFEPLISGGVSSWTHSRKFAQDFAADALDDKKRVRLILTAEVRNNSKKFVDCQNGLYSVNGLERYINEKEVIGIGKINVSKIEWSMIRTYQFDLAQS